MYGCTSAMEIKVSFLEIMITISYFTISVPHQLVESQLHEPMALPRIIYHLPMFDYVRDPQQGSEGELAPSPDDSVLRNSFPGQFFTGQEVSTINEEFEVRMRRKRREVDRDICCITNVWFGTAPSELIDAKDDKKWTLLKGRDMFQAYSRGECHKSNRPQTMCPSGGACAQKLRLHTLWVAGGTTAELKYFNIPSHCAYEKG